MQGTQLVLPNDLRFLQLSNFLLREAKLLEHDLCVFPNLWSATVSVG